MVHVSVFFPKLSLFFFYKNNRGIFSKDGFTCLRTKVVMLKLFVMHFVVLSQPPPTFPLIDCFAHHVHALPRVPLFDRKKNRW